jgi:hypothetical protein
MPLTTGLTFSSEKTRVGVSAPLKELQNRFGFTAEAVAARNQVARKAK